MFIAIQGDKKNILCVYYLNIMMNEKNEGYQYDRCASRGICSINPTTASLQEVILLYLKTAAYYGLKSERCGKKDKRITNLVLNTLSVLSSNYEISRANFEIINSAFKTELSRVAKEFDESCESGEKAEVNIFSELNTGLNDYIRYGEKEFNKRLQSLSAEERNLYGILFIIIKSFCINILIYESYGKAAEEEISLIYKSLILLNTPAEQKGTLINHISDISEQDCSLMKKIREAQEEAYGLQSDSEVSFSTTKGKAVLVVGSNLRELEQIADVFEGKNIDIYTHDNMVIAHTFPKFREYKNIKGQFGQGLEGCLLDFSTFPGPIILTRYSLFNVESLYRGRLFTTDLSYSKGVIPVKNNDFSEVIKSAEESKGFKTGKTCDSGTVGFSLIKIINEIKEKLESGSYSQIILIGTGGYSAEEKEYFKAFIQHAPQESLILTLFCCESKENVICINAMNDVYGMSRLFEVITATFFQKVTVIFPYSDRHTLSVIINLANNKNIAVYIGKWCRMLMKPDITEGLKTAFNIKEVTTPKNDLNIMTDIK